MKLKTQNKIGKIYYLNCLPFYYGLLERWKKSAPNLENPSFEWNYFESYPAEINQAMEESRIEMAPISSLEYLRHQGDYVLLPHLGIGTRHFSGSVLLVSKEKIEKLDAASIALTREGLSSLALLQILLNRKYGFKNDFKIAEEPLQRVQIQCKAALVIGDEALGSHPEDFLYKYDLGEIWWNWTGKPFVFALWAARKEFAKEHPRELENFFHLLRDNLRHNLNHLEELLEKEWGTPFGDKQFPKFLGYLANLHYELDGAMLEGLKHFYGLAYEMGLAPKMKPLEFFNLAK